MKRGQEEAPIEVLIGVTILTFVMIMGLYIFQSQCSSQYEVRMKASFSKFARNLESAYLGSIGSSFPTYVDFSKPTGCSGLNLHSINLVKGLQATCLANVGRTDCMQLVAYLELEPGVSVNSARPILLTEVIDIPAEDISIIGDFNQGDCGLELTSIDFDNPDIPNKNCGFKSSYNAFRITKEESNKIVISDDL